MKSIAALFWRICIFQAGPETVPANNTLVIVVIMLNMIVNVTVQLILPGEGTSALQSITIAVVSMAGIGGLVWFIMLLMQLAHRVPQTITALFGADIILTTITTVAYIIFGAGEIGATESGAARLIFTLLFFWSLAVYGFIFHHSMNIHIGIGIAIALFVVLFSFAITQTAIVQ